MPQQETSRFKTPLFAVAVVLVVLQTVAVAVFAYARLGDPRKMPDQLARLAIKVRNPRAYYLSIPPGWVQLCLAWDTWLPDLRDNGRRLVLTDGLWQPNDPRRQVIANFLAIANELRPESLVPEAAREKSLAVLAKSPPVAVMDELRLGSVYSRVDQASIEVTLLAVQLETWPEWDWMRSLLKLMQNRGFTRAAAALQPRLPPTRGTAGFREDTRRTLKLLNDVSLDETGMLRLLSRWSEFSRLAAAMQASGDPEQQMMPGRLLDRLTDQPTLAEFADALVTPLAELRRRSALASTVVESR